MDGTDRTATRSDGQDILARYRRAESLEQLLARESCGLSATVVPRWIGKSDRFWYAHTDKGETEYRLVDAKAGTSSRAFDHKALAAALSAAIGAPVTATALPIENLEFPAGTLAFEAFGKAWQFDEAAALTETAPRHPADWLVSPDKSKAVYIRDHNLWLRDLNSETDRALTTDGMRYHRYAAQPEGRDLVAGLEGDPGSPMPEALWSPDSRTLLTVQLDERDVGTMPSILFAPQDNTLRPRVVNTKYALPGDKSIPEYRFLMVDVATGQETAADYARVEDSFIWHGVFSGNRAWWAGDGKKAYFLDMARGQKSVRVVEMLAANGRTRVLLEERAETFLELGHNFEAPSVVIPIPDTDELIWFSHRSGFPHLYLYDLKSGEMKNPITSGDWSVRDAISFDANRREVVIQLMGRVKERDFYYREIARVNVDTGAMTLIASSDHDYKMYNDYGGLGGLSPRGDYVVSTHSRVDTPPVTDLRDRDGNVVLTLRESDTSVLPDGWRWPEPVKTLADDGKTPIYGVIFRPTDFDPQRPYPVLDFCHSNPFFAAVPKQAFGAFSYFGIAAAFAELGMIVVMMDGRGTSFRDKHFRDYGCDDLLENGGIRDHVAGIKQLAERYPFMDLSRVGIIDFDGSNAGVTGLLAFPEFYRVGVASSLYDPRLVKQGEVYMGLTTEEKRRKAAIWGDSVENLVGKLLITTGLRDSYFHPSATFRLTDALLKANKDFDHYVHPNGGHAWRLLNARRRIWDYLVRHLLQEEPPADFRLTTGLELLAPGQMTESLPVSR